MEKNKRVLALGFFDGVHLGHQTLLRACRVLAGELDLPAAALTFDRHPAALVSRAAPALINSASDRERLLRSFGMDDVLVVPFDKELMHTPWQDFFTRLITEYGAAGLVCGHDFRFGSRGEGTAEKLQACCAERALPCVIVPEQRLGGVRISSTHIRKLLIQGQMEEALRFLGRPHVLTGTVVAGQQLGRTIGIPTANLQIPEDVVTPRLGVYACKVLVDGKPYMAVTNVGTRPTVGGRCVTVEPWILDFSGDLYGKTITVQFFAFLRGEQTFPSLEALRGEILNNARKTREIFAEM